MKNMKENKSIKYYRGEAKEWTPCCNPSLLREKNNNINMLSFEKEYYNFIIKNLHQKIILQI